MVPLISDGLQQTLNMAPCSHVRLFANYLKWVISHALPGSPSPGPVDLAKLTCDSGNSLIGRLPLELALQIFSHCDDKGLFNLGATCKTHAVFLRTLIRCESSYKKKVSDIYDMETAHAAKKHTAFLNVFRSTQKFLPTFLAKNFEQYALENELPILAENFTNYHNKYGAIELRLHKGPFLIRDTHSEHLLQAAFRGAANAQCRTVDVRIIFPANDLRIHPEKKENYKSSFKAGLALMEVSQSLRDIHLKIGGRLPDDCAESIANLLASPKAKPVSLSAYRPSAFGTVALANAITENTETRVKTLELKFLSSIWNTDEGTNALAKMLGAAHTQLETLRLHQMEINVTTLAKALIDNPHTQLKYLDLSLNAIGKSGSEALANMLRAKHIKVEQLILTGCTIKDEDANLAKAVAVNTTLTSLHLVDQMLRSQTLNALHDALLSNPASKLTLLKLHQYTFTRNTEWLRIMKEKIPSLTIFCDPLSAGPH